MQIEFTGRQTEVPPEIRDFTERKLSKLKKVLGGITDVHVVLAIDRHLHVAEVNVRTPRLSLLAAEASGDFALSVSTVIDKLTRQAQKQLGKRRERKRRAPAKELSLWTSVLAPSARGDGGVPATGPASTLPAAVADRPEHEVVHARRITVATLSVAEASRRVARSDERVLVFRNADNNRVNVIYRRKDGHLGIIEPEV